VHGQRRGGTSRCSGRNVARRLLGCQAGIAWGGRICVCAKSVADISYLTSVQAEGMKRRAFEVSRTRALVSLTASVPRRVRRPHPAPRTRRAHELCAAPWATSRRLECVPEPPAAVRCAHPDVRDAGYVAAFRTLDTHSTRHSWQRGRGIPPPIPELPALAITTSALEHSTSRTPPETLDEGTPPRERSPRGR
jgi:hypothetical protein